MKRPVSRSHCPPAFFNPERETESAWVPRETVNKLGSPLHCCSEARTIAGAAHASPYPRARVRCSEELIMTTSVGIDVSKDSLEWAHGAEGEVQRTRNEPRSIAELVRHLVSIDPDRIVIESTGGYERRLVEKLAAAGRLESRAGRGVAAGQLQRLLW